MQKKLFGNYTYDDLKDFYIYNKPNPNGIILEDMWKFSDEEYENNHTFIQWMFPLPTLSLNNLYAPKLTNNMIINFKKDDDIVINICMSYICFLHYLGINYDEKLKKLVLSADFENKKNLWLTKNNHNFKRIARCLKCLRLIGADEYAQAFIEILKEIDKENPRIITKKEWKYWK